MYYKGKKSGYVDVQNFDVNGVGYVRKTGNVPLFCVQVNTLDEAAINS